MEQERAEYLNRILVSSARHRLVISGPGTGKTFTFGKILENDPRASLVITLINNLVDDMQADIGNLADVRTFHSFARLLLHQNPFGGITPRFHFFPGLAEVISADSYAFAERVIADEGFDYPEFERAFRLLSHDAPSLSIFMPRADYYDSVGFDDSVYRIHQLFAANRDAIPTYNIVMVDEYQDFNPLEVGVLEFLESVNRTLIVGDDDQSIYHFRQASPEYLRAKASDPRYQQFPLPYSTRCTEVIVAAVDAIVHAAQANGLLLDRLQKDFICYLPEKQRDNDMYPRVQVVTCSVQRRNAPYVPRYIEAVLSNLPRAEFEQAHAEEYPLALVIGPGHYLDQVHAYLHGTDFNTEYQPSSTLSYSLQDGFTLIQERNDSNLGWRIISEFLLPDQFENLLVASADNTTPFISLLPPEFTQAQLRRLETINRAQRHPQAVPADEIQDIESVFGEPFESLFPLQEPRPALAPDQDQQVEHQPDHHVPTILLTNYNGSKGLSAGFTFVLGFEEGIFPKYNAAPTFTEVCQLIVALTRTRKQCHLIHTGNFAGQWNARSVFLDWIPAGIGEAVQVNKDYF